MNKVVIIIISVCFLALMALLGTLSGRVYALGQENAQLQASLANRESLLQAQNAAIEKQALDLEYYATQKERVREQIIMRYALPKEQGGKGGRDMTTCEAQIELLGDLLNEFYGRASD